MTTGPLEVGLSLPTLTVSLSRTDLVRYAGASGDFNPIHHSDFFAVQVGLPGVIGHGMLTMGTALRVITDWIGDPAAVRSYFVRFTKPVVVPDDGVGAELRVVARITDVTDELVRLAIEATVAADKVLGMASAEVDLRAMQAASARQPGTDG